jgi:dihydroorotate dehydrogenase electron transfer subunit
VRHTVELPVMRRILDTKEVSASAREVWLDRMDFDIKPGQFIMLWIPELDEKPYTVTWLELNKFAVTVVRRGAFSSRLMKMKPGEYVGVRGPYGKGFAIPAGKGAQGKGAALLSGGCGIATVTMLKRIMPHALLISGAKTTAELLYAGSFADMEICTDDGSAGERGLPTDLLLPHLKKCEVKMVYTCTPTGEAADGSFFTTEARRHGERPLRLTTTATESTTDEHG